MILEQIAEINRSIRRMREAGVTAKQEQCLKEIERQLDVIEVEFVIHQTPDDQTRF